MKYRNGFVSNSSSSSFIIGFKKKIRNRSTLESQLNATSTCMAGYDDTVTLDECLNHITDLLLETKLTSVGKIKKDLAEYGDEEYRDCLKDLNPDLYYYMIDIGDHSSVGAECEHGNFFNNVFHIRINNH